MEHRAAALSEMPPGRPTLVEVGGVPVVLTRVGDSVYACSDVCAHRGGALHEGRLSGFKLTCPLHGWLFDVRTGQCLFPPRGSAVASYPVRIDGDAVLVDVP